MRSRQPGRPSGHRTARRLWLQAGRQARISEQREDGFGGFDGCPRTTTAALPGDIQDVVVPDPEELERHCPSRNWIERLAKLFRPQAVEQQARDDAGRVRLGGKREKAHGFQCNNGFIENPLDALDIPCTPAARSGCPR